MTTSQTVQTKGLVFNRETAPAFWLSDTLWVILVDGSDTEGAYSVIEQWMRKDSGAIIPHIHAFSDEWFYVFNGELSMTVGDESFTGRGSDSIWIPRGTVHHFKVESEVSHVLNGYTPAGTEQILKGIGVPAQRCELPPNDFPKPDKETVHKIFNNYWTSQADMPWAHPDIGMQ